MEAMNRRQLLRSGATACAAVQVLKGSAAAPIKLGLVVSVRKGGSVDEVVQRVHSLGFPTCQIGVQELDAGAAGRLKSALRKYSVQATALIELGPGRMVWDFYEGPLTIGLVPRDTRQARIASLKQAADVAAEAGIPAVHTHCGFIPENPNDPLYAETVAAIREVASYAKQKGLQMLCETGQESPVTLLRAIHDVGLDNIAVNLDTANLVFYGKGNPVDAMDVIGQYVKGLHAKDGLFPTDPKHLGKEVPIGTGKVDFRALITRLKQVDYHGPMTIEREIHRPEQTRDILQSKAYLEKVIADVYGG